MVERTTRATATRLETLKRGMYGAMPFLPGLWEMARPSFEAGGRLVKAIVEIHVIYMVFDNAVTKWLLASLAIPQVWLAIASIALLVALFLYRRERFDQKHSDPDPGQGAVIVPFPTTVSRKRRRQDRGAEPRHGQRAA